MKNHPKSNGYVLSGSYYLIFIQDNFHLLANIEVLLSLSCFIPLLDVVYSLMKFSQEINIFICDFMQGVKVCQGELARRFIDAPFSILQMIFHNTMTLFP